MILHGASDIDQTSKSFRSMKAWLGVLYGKKLSEERSMPREVT
jgi:hypothetical protein